MPEKANTETRVEPPEPRLGHRLLVGRELAPSSERSPHVETAEIPAGPCLVFRCRGPLPGAVMDGWRHAWAFFAQPGAPARAYTADVEVYDADGGGLEIWVAIEKSGSIPGSSRRQVAAGRRRSAP